MSRVADGAPSRTGPGAAALLLAQLRYSVVGLWRVRVVLIFTFVLPAGVAAGRRGDRRQRHDRRGERCARHAVRDADRAVDGRALRGLPDGGDLAGRGTRGRHPQAAARHSAAGLDLPGGPHRGSGGLRAGLGGGQPRGRRARVRRPDRLAHPARHRGHPRGRDRLLRRARAGRGRAGAVAVLRPGRLDRHRGGADVRLGPVQLRRARCPRGWRPSGTCFPLKPFNELLQEPVQPVPPRGGLGLGEARRRRRAGPWAPRWSPPASSAGTPGCEAGVPPRRWRTPVPAPTAVVAPRAETRRPPSAAAMVLGPDAVRPPVGLAGPRLVLLRPGDAGRAVRADPVHAGAGRRRGGRRAVPGVLRGEHGRLRRRGGGLPEPAGGGDGGPRPRRAQAAARHAPADLAVPGRTHAGRARARAW